MEEGGDDYEKKMREEIWRRRTCIRPRRIWWLQRVRQQWRRRRRGNELYGGGVDRVGARVMGRTPEPFGSMVPDPRILCEFMGHKRGR
jgi:hypothetical protein